MIHEFKQKSVRNKSFRYTQEGWHTDCILCHTKYTSLYTDSFLPGKVDIQKKKYHKNVPFKKKNRFGNTIENAVDPEKN